MQTAKIDVQALRQAIRAKVDALPQRDLIAAHDARFWSEEVVAQYGELAHWHVARAGGFGGSQIGALVRNHLGQRADHSSAHDIVEGALLRRLPDDPNGAMQRGVWMEPHHREFFYKRWSAVRDESGFNKLAASTGVRSWMRYSPDELCFMSAAVLGGPANERVRILGDFKAPTEAHGVNFEYLCQLNMGHAICTHQGIKVDGLMLSQFDWKNWALRDEWVDADEELQKHIVTAGDHYWNEYVMKGQVPAYVLKPRLDPSGQIVQEVAAPLGQLSKLKALATFVKDKIDELEEQVKPKLQGLRFGGAKLVIGGLSYSAQQQVDVEKARELLPHDVLASLPLKAQAEKRYDEKALTERLKQLDPQVNLKAFLKPSNLDSDALREALEAHGHDPDQVVTEKLVARVDKTVAEQTTVWAQAHVHQLIGAATQAAAVEHLTADGGEDDENDREGHSSLRHVPASRS